MTKDDYLRIAREIDTGQVSSLSGNFIVSEDQIIAFASAIAALEREECAKMVNDSMFEFTLKAGVTKDGLLAAIRNKEK